MAENSLLNFLGSYPTLGSVWEDHPEGGREGDYLNIGGIEHVWDKYLRQWVRSISSGSGGSGDTVDGDLVVGGNLSVGGNVDIDGTLTVNGEAINNQGEPGMGTQTAYTVVAEDTVPVLINRTNSVPISSNSTWQRGTNSLVVGEGQALWMSERVYENGGFGPWSDPLRISGADGEPGADGLNIEFIYRRSNNLPTVQDIPSDSPQTRHYVPAGWNASPSGVDTSHKYEWMTQRLYTDGAWGAWSRVFVWSAYGDKGMDGDGYQYVFRLSATRPDRPGVGGVINNQGELIPHGWTDDPTGVTENDPKEWVSQRRRVNGSWRGWSEPTLWNTYSKDHTISISSDGFWVIDGVKTGTRAEGKGVTIKGRVDVLSREDMASGQTCLEDVSNPTEGEADVEVGDCYIVDDNGTDNGHLYIFVGGSGTFPANWYDLGSFKGEAGESNYIHTAWCERIVYQYSNGILVVDGNGKPVVNTAASGDLVTAKGVYDYNWMGLAVTGSEDAPTGLNGYDWTYLKGADGNGVEHVYIRTKKDTETPVIDATAADTNDRQPTEDEYLPVLANGGTLEAEYIDNGSGGTVVPLYQFTDDPKGIDETYRYEWIAKRKKVDGVWRAWSTPVKHNIYTTGRGVAGIDEYYLITTAASGVTNGTAGFSTTYQEPTESLPYLWRFYRYTYTDGTTEDTTAELVKQFGKTPVLRVRRWVLGTDYEQGLPTEDYLDVVYDIGRKYRCRASHTSASGNRPAVGGNTWWEEADEFGMIAGEVILAEQASIDNLIADHVQTDIKGRPRVEMYGATARFFGTLATPSIEMMVDADGSAFLRFFDKDGNELYDLGPRGISWLRQETILAYFSKTDGQYVKMTNDEPDMLDTTTGQAFLYQFNAQRTNGTIQGDNTYTGGNAATAAAADGKYFTSNVAIASNTLADGLYRPTTYNTKRVFSSEEKAGDIETMQAEMLNYGLPPEQIDNFDWETDNNLAIPAIPTIYIQDYVWFNNGVMRAAVAFSQAEGTANEVIEITA